MLSLDLADSTLANSFFSGLVAPVYGRESYSDQGDPEARSVFRFSYIETVLKKDPAARTYATSTMFAAFQRKLEAVGKLAAEGFVGNQKSPDVVWREIDELLAFMRVRSSRGGFDSERWKLEKSLGRVARIAVRVANLHGKAALDRAIAEIDASLVQLAEIGQLGSMEFRKAYALAVHDIDRNTDAAIARLKVIAEFGGERTPTDYVQNVADAAETFTIVGAVDEARELLSNVYEHTLGIVAPAKKDGQYELWRDLYRRACAEDPVGAEKRIKFFSRLLSGLSETEGRGAAGRVAVDHLVEAARFSPQLGDSVSKQLQKCGLLSWPTLLGGLLLGVAERDNSLALASERIFARMAIPFMGNVKDEILAKLLEIAPVPDKGRILDHAIRCIETDAEVAIRRPLLNKLNDVGSRYGLAVPSAVLDRWKLETESTARSSTDDDPFAGAASLEELPDLLTKAGDSNTYRAVGAFLRLAPSAPLDQIKRIAMLPVIAENDRALHAIAIAAIAAGDLEYVEVLKEKFQKKAVENGSWGSWQSGAKFRLHSLFVALEGESAKVRAFNLFAQDLAQGREWTVSLLPNVVDIFELLSPRPSWSSMWDTLTDHLEQFRDYQSGKELVVEGATSDEELLADVIVSGLKLALHDMSWQCRLAAQDMADSASSGTAVLQKLITKLGQADGDCKLEAVRVAWESRDCAALRESLIALAQQMMHEDDIALVLLGGRLGAFLGVELELPPRPLPGYYSLTFPPDAQANNFEKPSGYSQTSAGLWTEDTNSWTWPLQRPLRLLASTSRFDVATLRRRAGELMRRNGGRGSFGPEVVEARGNALRRLELEVLYRRLPVLAAFRAFRQTCCELAAAGECDPRAVPILAGESGGPAYLMRTFEAKPRPRLIERSLIMDAIEFAEVVAWLEAEESAATWPAEDETVVIASVAEFDRISYRRKRTEERLLLRREEPIVAQGLLESFSELPIIDVIDGLVLRYDGIADGGVACVREDIAGSTPDNLLMLCPRLAEQSGFSPHPANPFGYLDDEGNVAVQTIWWRDGGVARHGGDRSVRGQGSVVLATTKAFETLKLHLGSQRCVHVWRGSTDDDRPTVVNAHRFARVVAD